MTPGYRTVFEQTVNFEKKQHFKINADNTMLKCIDAYKIISDVR